MLELDRYNPALGGRIRYEHYHRYAFACEQVAGLKVLDIASGEGYGSAMLAASAARVSGVDTNPFAVSAANLRYGQTGRLSFHVGQAEDIPFPDDSFDAVISFETIGHIDNPEALLREIKRVLKPNGFAFISTLNKSVYERGLAEPNALHPREMEMAEFVLLLEGAFKSVAVYGQRMVIASAIGPVARQDASRNVAEYRGYTVTENGDGSPLASPAITRFPPPDHVVCIVGEGALPHPTGADSMFLMRDHDLWAEYAKAMQGASELREKGPTPRGAFDHAVEEARDLSAANVTVATMSDLERVQEQEITRLRAGAKSDLDLSALGPLLEDIAGEPLSADMPTLIRLLNRISIQRATQDVRLAEYQEIKASVKAAAADAEDAWRKVRDAEELALKQADLVDSLSGKLQQRQAAGAKDAQVLAEISTAHEKALEESSSLAGEIATINRRYDEMKSQWEREREGRLRAEAVLVEQREKAASELKQAREKIAATLVTADNLMAEQASLGEAWRESEDRLREARTAVQAREDAERLLTAELESARNSVEARDKRIADLELHLLPVADKREKRGRDAEPPARAVADTNGDGSEITAHNSLAPSAKVSLTSASATRAALLRHVHDARFSETLRARRGEAAMDSVKSIRVAQEAVDAVRSRRSAIHEKLRRSHAALEGLPKQKSSVTLMASPAAAPPKSIRSRTLALLKGRSIAGEKRRDSRLSDALLKALFDADYYVRANGLSLSSGQSALDHYFSQGRQLGLSTHPLIDPDWLRQTRPGNVAARFDLVEYLVTPDLFQFSPHPLFDAEYYFLANPDVLQAGANPLAHYLIYGWREGRSPNPLFDSGWYLAENSDVLRSGANPLVHYAQYGASENRQPHPLFDRNYYLARNPDVATSGMDAYAHYIAYGRIEGRKPSSLAEEVEHYVPMFHSDGAVDLLLGGEPSERLKPAGKFWPPAWDGQYWLPQRLRDLVIDRYGTDQLDLYIYLFSVIERFEQNPDAFVDSLDCDLLIERARRLAAPMSDFRPTVSIVVPVYNNLLYTLTCIVSVLEIQHDYSFEIIVADDLSSDGTRESIETIGGIVRLNRNATNLGFLRNCNAAAVVAKGDYLVMLNNDVIVLPGWLNNLIEPLVRDPQIGFVGSKLINGDGTLQEAGGIFWQDGSAWNYGRNSDASLPEFNYLKDIDYVSGASIAIPRKVWDEMEGFDPIFTPAYCEDSDIAFRVRAAGYRTVYHPHSVLVHHEGRSHGRDTGVGIKAYQVINQRKFLERWGDTLVRDHFPNAKEVFAARDRSRNKPRILIIDHYVPQWDRDAGSRTVFQYIRMFLERGFAVTFWPDNLHEDREYSEPLQAMGVEVIYHPAYVGRFASWIAENGRYFDYALLCRPHIAEHYIDNIRAQRGIQILYYGVDLHCKRLEASYEVTGDRALLEEAARWEVVERRICAKCDVVLYPGFHEVEVVRTWVPNDIAVLNFPITIFSDEELENGLANLSVAAEADPFSLMFVGGFNHHPNVGGVKWFVEEVLSRLRRSDPRFHIRIAGSNAPPEINSLAGDGVTLLGRVSDDELMEMYRTSAFAIVPLLYGAGVKGKVVEAMARGVPLAMTSVGAQGIEDAEDLAIVEDDPAKMANAILAASGNRVEVINKARTAVEFIRRWYSEGAVEALLLPHIPELATIGQVHRPTEIS